MKILETERLIFSFEQMVVFPADGAELKLFAHQ